VYFLRMPGVDWVLKKYPEKPAAPPCLGEALRRGALLNIDKFTIILINSQFFIIRA
jgi:hypothetical protein